MGFDVHRQVAGDERMRLAAERVEQARIRIAELEQRLTELATGGQGKADRVRRAEQAAEEAAARARVARSRAAEAFRHSADTHSEVARTAMRSGHPDVAARHRALAAMDWARAHAEEAR